MHHPIIPTAGHHPHHQHQTPAALHCATTGFMRSGGPFQVNNEFPLRILVQSGMVGAIIGRSGSTIKLITQQSKARIDVHREESLDQQEKVITINGTPDSCSVACFKILEVIQNEKIQMSNNNNNNISNSNNNINNNNSLSELDKTTTSAKSDSTSSSKVQLKILAHNNLIGRLIGKSGASIKKIMEQTSTKINISMNSLSDCTHERSITVVGNIEQVRQAEQIISSKLKTAYMSDINKTMLDMNNHSPYLFNNVTIPYLPGQPYTQNPLLSTLVNTSPNHSGPAIPRSMGRHQAHLARPQLYSNSSNYLSTYPNITIPPTGLLGGYNSALGCGSEAERETVNIYIPNNMVGAIIGKSGNAIKEMIRDSGASIKVAATPTIDVEPDQTTNTLKEMGSETNQPPQQQQQKQKNNKSDSVNGEVKTDDESKTEDGPKTNASSKSTGKVPPSESHDSQESQPDNTCMQSNARHHGGSESNLTTRRVTVVGNPEAQWSAQFLIYRKVSMESGKSDISLMVELQVPSQLVGKIIGRGGTSVKNLQKQTRTTIRLPDEKPNPSSDAENLNSSETCVQITGEFQCSQLAQRHIRNLIRENLYSSSRQATKS